MIRRIMAAFGLLLALLANPLSAQEFDLVIAGGRVIDPETRLDAPRNVGINGATIARISEQVLHGKRTLQAHGLVVAPGFIDVHQHAQTQEAGRLKALDGVTTALEMELGAPDVAAFLRAKMGRSLINYGTTASYVAARALAFDQPLASDELVPEAGTPTNSPASEAQLLGIERRLGDELDAGALAVGVGIEYIPGSTRMEVIRVFRVAAAHRVPIFAHVRSAGYIEPGSGIEAVEEVIGAAAVTGAAVHIAHINSICMKDWRFCLSLIEGANKRGLRVTTEAYPYIAGLTYINSAIFNAGWDTKRGLSYSDIRIPRTGEPLNKDRFDELRRSSQPIPVLLYSNTQETVDDIIAQPDVIIASDGFILHPRNAGTYSRVLARYVRELHVLTLTQAIGKMTILPAKLLEEATPRAHQKGRLQEGADADVVVFDPLAIRDRSTFEEPELPSVGVRHVIVNGTILIRDGKVVPQTFPGRPL